MLAEAILGNLTVKQAFKYSDTELYTWWFSVAVIENISNDAQKSRREIKAQEIDLRSRFEVHFVKKLK